MAENVKVNINDMGTIVHLEVVGLNVFRARWWIARQLFILGARVSGCSITVTDEIDDSGVASGRFTIGDPAER